MRGLATDWFRVHLPGLFASGILAGEFPTCEFLTLRNAVPFPPHSDRGHTNHEWLRILDIYYDSHAWRAKKLSGLKFVWPLSDNIDFRFHAGIVAREKDFSNEMLRAYGGNNRSTLVYYIDQVVNGLLTRWALAGFLSGFERYLNNIRDSVVKPNDSVKPAHLLERLAGHISQSVDISAVAVELQNFATHKRGWVTYDIGGFCPCNPALYRNAEIVLIEKIRQQIADRAEWLRNVDRSVRDILVQYGATLGVRENIKLQKRMACLTWVILTLTIVMAVLTTVTTVMSNKAGSLSWPW